MIAVSFLARKQMIEDLKKAKQFLAQQHYLKASELLEKQYQLKKTFEINYWLTQAYCKLGQATKAYQLATEYLHEYVKEEKMLSFYVQVGLEAKQTLKMQQLIVALKDQLSVQQVDFLQNEIATKPADANYQAFLKKFNHLGAFELFEQRLLVQEMYQLTPKDFIASAKKLLIDVDVHQLIKAQLFEELLKLQVTDEINYVNLWSEQQTIKLAHLVFLEDTKIYAYYQKKLMDINLIEQAQLAQELYLKLMLLYPDFSRVDDFESWYDILLNRTPSKTASLLEEQLKMWEI